MNGPKEEISLQKEFAEKIRLFHEQKTEQAFAVVVTYGCAGNENDSEKIKGMLKEAGYTITDDKSIADIIIFNTCCVRENAELKVFGNIGALKNAKVKNPNLIIGVCGCMMQQEHIVKTIKEKYRHVELVFGTHTLHKMPSLIHDILVSKRRNIDIIHSDGEIYEDIPSFREGQVKAGVSVMYGCNNFCTYCIVPFVRGRERSREMNDILAEIRLIASEGCKEVMLIGQNVNSYGKDLAGCASFHELLHEVSGIDDIERIRFITSHPKDISSEIISVMRDNPKICKQLHLPLQAGSNRILKAMNRRYTKEEYLVKVEEIQKEMPDIAITSDIIVGFPNETKEDFEETLEVLRKVRFDNVYSFIYSKRMGTPAAEIEDIISDAEKKENFARLLSVQGKIAKEINHEYTGKVYDVLVEGSSKTNPDMMTGRTDSGKIVNFAASKTDIGKIIPVKIVKAQTFSLSGEKI